MKTMFLSLMYLSFGYSLGGNGSFEMFFQAFVGALFDLAIFMAIIGCVVFIFLMIRSKIREREIIGALQWNFFEDLRFVVLKSVAKRELKDFFYESSNIKNYFDDVEIVFNGKIFEVPEMMPVKITKLRLNNKTLKVYVDVVEMECNFDVTWVGKSFGEKPLGDDAMRVNLQNVKFGNQQVSRQQSQIPESIEKGDKVRMKFIIVDNKVNLFFISKL